MNLERLRIRNEEGLEGQTRKRVAPPNTLWETMAQTLKVAVWVQSCTSDQLGNEERLSKSQFPLL